MADHRRPVEGCRAKRGHPCPHVVARCRNCRGKHLSQANVSPAKKEARQVAKGWRSPSPHAGSGAPPRRQTARLRAPRRQTGEKWRWKRRTDSRRRGLEGMEE